MAANQRHNSAAGSDFFYNQWKSTLLQRMNSDNGNTPLSNQKEARTAAMKARPPTARPSSAVDSSSSSHSPRSATVPEARMPYARSATLFNVAASSSLRRAELTSPRTAASDNSNNSCGGSKRSTDATQPASGESCTEGAPASALARPPSSRWRAAATPPLVVPMTSPRPQSSSGRTNRPPPLCSPAVGDCQQPRRPNSRNGRDPTPVSPQTLPSSAAPVVTSRSLCALYHDTDDHFSNGRIHAAWAALSSLQGLPEATLMSAPSLLRLPSCCDQHPLLVARLVTLVCGPAEGSDVYCRLVPAGSDAGETGERNAVASLVKCGGGALSDSETAAHTDAAIDVFSVTCRPLAVHWLLWKAARLAAYPLRLSDALRAAERAAMLMPQCCHAASAVGILRVCLLGDELAVALSSTGRGQIHASGGGGSHCRLGGVVSSSSSCSGRLPAAHYYTALGGCTEGDRHFFCKHFAPRLRKLQDLQLQLARLRLTDQMVALDNWKQMEHRHSDDQSPTNSTGGSPEHPASIAQIERHIEWRLDLLRIRLLLQQNEHPEVVAQLVEKHKETGCTMDKHLWQQLRLQSLAGCGRWREAYAITEEWERSGACSSETTLSFRLHLATQLAKTLSASGTSVAVTPLCFFAANAQPLQILGFQRGTPATTDATGSLSVQNSGVVPRVDGDGTLASRTPSKSDIHRRYRQLCLVWHPDKWRGRHGTAADDATDVAAFCFRFIGDAYKRALDAL